MIVVTVTASAIHVVLPELAIALHVDRARARVAITYRGRLVRETQIAKA